MPSPAWSDVALLMHMDGADGSTVFVEETGKTVTLTGAAQITTAQSKFGGASGLFSGGYVEVGAASDFKALNDGSSWVAEFWTKGASTSEIFFSTCSGSTAQTGVYVSLEAGRKVGLFVFRGATSTFVVATVSTNAIPDDDQLHYIEVGFDAGSSLFRIFIDGTLSDSISPAASFANVSPQHTLAIGGSPATGAYRLNRVIDEIRIAKVAPDSASFTPPDSPFTGSTVTIEMSGQMLPVGSIEVDNWLTNDIQMSGQMLPSGVFHVFNPPIIAADISGQMLPVGSMLVFNPWEIDAELSGRMAPLGASCIVVDNVDPGELDFVSINGILRLVATPIHRANIYGVIAITGEVEIDTFGVVSVDGLLRLINGETSSCWCGNG